jgi:hypothetical protein
MKLILNKMKTELLDVVQYTLDSSNSRIKLNEFLGKSIKLIWTGNLFCRKCTKKTKKSFGEGFCYQCFISAPEASPCILHPELCEAHLGKGRDLEYEKKNHNQPHFVYLAATDIVKVGVTRCTQVPTRWIDQGANKAIILAETLNRYQAGLIEVALKSIFADKTNWQNMLRNLQDDTIDLVEEKWQVEEILPSDLSKFITDNEEVLAINYPVLSYPSKVNSVSFDKTKEIGGILTGIRGQYLILDNQQVVNIRRHTGYEIEWSA